MVFTFRLQIVAQVNGRGLGASVPPEVCFVFSIADFDGERVEEAVYLIALDISLPSSLDFDFQLQIKFWCNGTSKKQYRA